MTTGERIKELRLEKGMSQEELGKLIGVQRAAINKYEKGLVINLKREVIAKLATALGTTPTDLMGWADEDSDQKKEPTAKSDGLKSIGFYDLTQENQDMVAALIEKLLKSQSDS